MRVIRDYPDYQVSRDGIVYSLLTGEAVKAGLSSGYEVVWLRNSLGAKSLRVHRLVAQAYLLRRKGKTEVNHKDLNKRNNNVSNLEWCTHQENMTHAVMNGAYAGRITSYSQRSGKKLKTPLCYITAYIA
jgi:hypothetical protein